MSEVRTGPISSTSESDTMVPVWAEAPKVARVSNICKESTAPAKNPVSATIGSEPTPMMSICIRTSFQ